MKLSSERLEHIAGGLLSLRDQWDRDWLMLQLGRDPLEGDYRVLGLQLQIDRGIILGAMLRVDVMGVHVLARVNLWPRAIAGDDDETGCIYCGCTDDNACSLMSGDVASREWVTCAWYSRDPLVCSHPDCVAQFAVDRRHRP